MEKYIEDMFENEYLYFNSLNSFRSPTKDRSGRLDPRELNLKNEQLKTFTISDGSKKINLHEVIKGFNAQYNEHLTESNILCCSFHWMEIEQGFPPSTFNDKLIELGDKTLLIYDYNKFFDILDKSLETLGLEYSRRKVEYYDPTSYDGELTLHQKNEKYKWQNEFRILIAPVEDRTMQLELKGLKKISFLMNTKDLGKLRIKLKN